MVIFSPITFSLPLIFMHGEEAFLYCTDSLGLAAENKDLILFLV